MKQLSYKEITNAYTKQISHEINQSNNTLRPFMMTIRFKHIPLSPSSNFKKYCFFSDATWSQYSKTYRFVLSQLDRHFDKRPHLHPRTYDFFDVDNTSKFINASFTENTIPHIHSIYLIHEKTLPAFNNLIQTEFYKVKSHHSMCNYIQSIDARPILDNLPRAVAYCSKFYDNCYARAMIEDYELHRQLPLTKEEKEELALQRESCNSMFSTKARAL